MSLTRRHFMALSAMTPVDVVSHPAVTCVIPRTSNPHPMIDNLMAGFGAMPDAAARARMEGFIDGLA